MRRFIKILSVVILATIFAIGPVRPAKAAPTLVDLGTAGTFAILAGTQVTNVPTSKITGNVGLSPAAGSNYAGLTQAEVTGVIYSVNASGPAGYQENPALLTTAKNDLTAAYTNAAGRTVTTDFGATDNQLGGKTLTPGVYAIGHAATANLTAAAPLTLDAQGDPSAVFIFKSSSDLVMAAASEVRLINDAQACNVFWQVTSSATLLAGANFKGTILALTSITVAANANIEGRLLARNGNVTLISDTVALPNCTLAESAAAAKLAAAKAAAAAAKLPSTGTIPTENGVLWGIVVLNAIVTISILVYLVRKKRTD